MHSDRTIGFEFTNRENTLANFSADGALLFMQHGREYDNIFAHWDWRMVPGTTAYDDGAPLKCDNSVEARKNRSGHVGGLASGDVLCTTMEIERDGLHALKSAFFFGDLVVALGADIRSSDARIFRITTALDQTHLAGPVTRGGATETSGSLPWVHHDGRGYVSLDGAPIAVSTEIQEGKWDLIDPFYRDRTQRGRFSSAGSGMIRPGRAAMPTLFCRAATRNGPNGLPGIPPCGYFGTMPDVRPSNTGKYAAPWFTGPENTASAGGRSRRRNRRSTSSAAAGPRSAAFRP